MTTQTETEREMAPLRRGDRKLHRLTVASPLGRQFALMGKMETRRRREDESGRIPGNRKRARPEGTDDQEREKVRQRWENREVWGCRQLEDEGGSKLNDGITAGEQSQQHY